MLKDRLKWSGTACRPDADARVVFYGVAFLLVITSRKPSAPPQACTSAEYCSVTFGHVQTCFEFGSLKPFAPNGKVSFIMDIPTIHDARMDLSCRASSPGAPCANPFPSERVAIINCSNAAMAIRRSMKPPDHPGPLRRQGYRRQTTMTFFRLYFSSFAWLSADRAFCNIPVSPKILFLSAVSFPIGYGACSLLLFFAYLVAPPVATWATLVAGLGIMIFSVKKLLSSFRPTRLSFWAKSIGPFSLPKFNLLPTVFLITGFLLFVFILIRTLDFYSLTISLNVFGGWDAYYFWALKAKFMFRAPAEWQNLFSPDLFWTHPDYPLLLPGSLAWGWLWLGKEAFLWPPFLAIGFYLSCAFLLIWYLTSTMSAFTGYLGGSFFLILGPCFFWAVHFYADIPLSFFIAGATLTAVIALREKEEKLWRVSGLLSGLATWTKNEGILFILSFSCL